MSNSCCISSAKKTFFVKDLHIFEALKMIYNSPNQPEKLYRLPYEYKKSKKMLKSSDNVLSILHHKFSSWSWGGGGGFWLFQIESLPDSP